MELIPDNPARWWKASDKVTQDAAHGPVFDYLHALKNERNNLVRRWMCNAKLYDNRGCRLAYATDISLFDTDYRVINENVIKSAVDTLTARIAKNRPRARFMTDGADYSKRRQANKLEKFVEGTFQENYLYEKAQGVFRDALIFGTGILKWYVEHGKVRCERVIVDELWVDEKESRCGNPRQMHQAKFVDRDVLKHEFPDMADEIDRASDGQNHQGDFGLYNDGIREVEPNEILVVESWHLPSGPGADDGANAIFVDGATLKWEKYTKDEFPFTVLRWSNPLDGYYGVSAVEEVAGMQLEIHKLNKHIRLANDRISVPRVYVHVADAGMAARLNSTIGQIITYKKQKPEFETPRGVTGEIVQRLNDLIRRVFEQLGVSQLSAQSRKPSGLDSAPSLREFNDIETERFSIQAQRYESFFLECGRQVVTHAKEAGRGTRAVWRSSSLAKEIEWSEVEPKDQMFEMDIEAASITNSTPAGRTAQIVEWLQAGLIDASKGRQLLRHPDLEEEQTLATAANEYASFVLEQLLDRESEEDDLPVPDPMTDLQVIVDTVRAGYQREAANRAPPPEHILEGMRTFVDNAISTLKRVQEEKMAEMQAEQQLAMAQQGMAAGPEGAAAPAPTAIQPGKTFPHGNLAPGTPTGLA